MIGNTRIAGQAGAAINLESCLAGNLAETRIPIIINNLGWTYGIEANQVNVIYADKITLTDGATTTLDLYESETLLDVFNRALTMTALKLLYIKNNSSDAKLLVLGGVENDIEICADTGDIIKLKPKGCIIYVDPSASGLDITTNKNLKLKHDGAGSSSMDIDIIALGLD